MEMESGLETNSAPLLAIGRQGYGLITGDEPSSSCFSGNGSMAMRVEEEGEYWQEADALAHGSWGRTFPGEPSQMQGVPRSQRLKRQNCSGLVQGHWDARDGISVGFDETGAGSSGSNMEIEGTLEGSSGLGIAGFSGVDQGCLNTSFDFLLNSSAIPGSRSSSSSVFLPNWVTSGDNNGEILPTTGSWSSATDLPSTGLRLGDVGSAMVCHSEAPSLEESRAGNLMVNLAENSLGGGFMMDYQSAEGQAPLSGNIGEHSGPAEAFYLPANMDQCSNGTEGSCGLPASMCAYSSSLLGSEEGNTSLSIGGLIGNSVDRSASGRLAPTSSGRRGSGKRKSLAGGSTGPLSFWDPQSSGRGENSFVRSIGGSGLIRPDVGNPSCGVDVDVFHSGCSTPMIHIWDDPQDVRSGLAGSESDNVTESMRGMAGKTLPLSGTGGSSQRSVRCRPVMMQQEQSQSALHPPVARNTRRFLPASSQSHGWSRRVLSAEQPVESVVHGVSNTTAAHGQERPVSAFSQRNGFSSSVPSWGGSNSLLRGSSNYSNFAATMFEGSRIRSLSAGASNWLGAATMDSRLSNQTSLDSVSRGVTSSTMRTVNAPENISRSQASGSSLLQPSAASWPASHLSALLSNRRGLGSSQGHMLPPATSNSSIYPVRSSLGASLEVVPSSAALYQGPCPRAVGPSLFMEGHGEGILMPSVQSLLGVPFRGLQMLQPEGENRRRFVTQILSALEHARRSEELSFEELVMLDPSVVFGGIDMHDQHSDMRLDVDNMSYEELLALEERIGNVSTGLSEEIMAQCLRSSRYSSLDATVAAISQESEIKCSICQEEYLEEDELSRLDCGHGYHTTCIKQWLVQKNQCPICKAAAHSKS